MVVAWLCANVPHSAYVGLFQHLGEMRHFSHQAQLAADTLSVITAQNRRATVKRVPTTQHQSAGHASALPGESLTKKLEFFADAHEAMPLPAEALVNFIELALGTPTDFQGDVPHPPPRV
jgi:hypothetical protein